MIGYVKVYKPELKIKEYEAYKGIYCTLCKTLGKEYGVLSRMLLSYDLTFLCVVLLSQSSSSLSFERGRCPFNLTKKCNYCCCSKEVFSYASAATVLMFYYKILDEIYDAGFLKKLIAYFLLPYASFLKRKAKKKYPKLFEIIKDSCEKQEICEKENTDSVDKAAHNSADALGKIFSCFNNNAKLYRFGYLVGRWVYLIDAADDLTKDIKTNSFNVFKNKYSLSSSSQITDEIRKDIEGTLNMCQGVLADAFMELETAKMCSIIENIIFDSFTDTIINVVKGIKSK